MNASPDVFDSIKSRYSLDIKGKNITTINNEDSGDLTFGKGSNNLDIEIENQGQDILLSDDEANIISIKPP